MTNHSAAALTVKAQFKKNGLAVRVFNKNYVIEYPHGVWQKTPLSIRHVLLENIAFAETHWLPLILNKNKLHCHFNQPLFEPLLFKNQLYDLLFCEEVDKVKVLSYLKRFYNLEISFQGADGAVPDFKAVSKFAPDPKTAIIPFTFGKESLATLALCLELGLHPILVYCQEPVQPFEEKYKLKKLEEIKKRFGVDYYFIKHQPGLFRYGRVFGLKKPSEIGWGTQVTLLTLLMAPFIYAFKARYLIFGNEYSNNEWKLREGWKIFPCADQTSEITKSQNGLIKLLTNGQSEVKSSLEPLEEINIFYLLHHRYPKLGQYQFSCSAELPLYRGSSWCHRCYKCVRMYLFAASLGFDPKKLGFKKNLLDSPGLWRHYFGKEVKTGPQSELDFAFYLLHLKKDHSLCVLKFEKEKLPRLKNWPWHARYFSSLKPCLNLPPFYQKTLLKIFREELSCFKKLFNA